MKVLNIIQGSPEWHAHRATAFNASDAPAMMGVSKYKSRAQLIKERATGIIPEVDDAIQRRFNDGHRFEALARPLAEAIIGEELSPITGVEGKYSASFDGITFDQSAIFEHKTLNKEISAALCAEGVTEDLDIQYLVQMEHQLMVSGAEYCLFMGSSFDENDELIEELHCWYYPNQELRARIVAGWEQFEKDVAAYVPTKTVEAPKAEAIQALPSVFVQATGMVTASNLAEFKEAATSFIAAIKTELVCDQDFADAEATVKFCKEAETNLDATKASVLAQMSTVDEVVRTLDHIKKQLADKRLMLDKLVKSEKELRKAAIVTKASADFAAHIELLEAETKPIRLGIIGRNFGEAIKGLKSLESMQEKVDTALRDEKFAADQTAKDVRAKLVWCKEHAAGQSALFPDLQALMAKPFEDFTLTITSRIEKQKADEAARLEAETARIRAEEEAKATAKAQAEAEAILAAERAKQAAEEAAAREAEKAATKQIGDAIEAAALEKLNTPPESQAGTLAGARPAVVSQTEPAAPVSTSGFNPANRARANRAEILEVLSENFGLPEELMLEWILAEFAGDIQFNNRVAA